VDGVKQDKSNKCEIGLDLYLIYLITIDASFCEQTSDREFCALIEHELYHIGVERDVRVRSSIATILDYLSIS
jgi:hypothetical protein